MSETDGKKPLGLRGARPGQVKQSFSHGRTKNVVVETKRKRVVVPKQGAGAKAEGGAAAAAAGDPSRRPAGITDAEMELRLKALQAARAREADEARERAACSAFRRRSISASVIPAGRLADDALAAAAAAEDVPPPDPEA